MAHYDVPGVYVEEQTGPGVIAGVGTSTAAFIGPALQGPINEAVRISSYDEFLQTYGIMQPDGRLWPYITEPRHFYLAHAVRGYFQNGGRLAYVVRVGTGRRSRLAVDNQGGEDVFVVEASQEGTAGDNIQVATEQASVHDVATGSAQVTAIDGAQTGLTVDTPTAFRVGDVVSEDNTVRSTVTNIQGNIVTINAPLAGLAVNDTLRIANVPPAQSAFRMIETSGLYAGGMAILFGEDASNPGNDVSERVEVQSVNSTTRVVTLSAAPVRAETYAANVATIPTLTSIRVLAVGQSQVTAIGATGTVVTVNSVTPFQVGDIVTHDGAARASITRIQGNDLTLSSALANLNVNDTLRIADIVPQQSTFRVNDVRRLHPGGVVLITGDDANNPGNQVTDYAIIQSVTPVGLVTVRNTPVRTQTFNMNVAAASAPILTPQEFRLVITPPAGSGRPVGRIGNLSAESLHPRYIFNSSVLDEISNFDATARWVRVIAPDVPPVTATLPGRLVAVTASTPLAGGQDDQPSALTSVHYQDGLNVLRDIDDVNLLCIPDGAAHPEWQTIHQAMINHCLLSQLQDRFAILDSIPGAAISGTGSVEQHRANVQADRGFAALYYPWLEVRDPQSAGPIPRTIYIPPCGHVAGVYARTDTEQGVHVAPANATVRGVLGLERVLSDGQHGPLNLAGINVLRVFPGSGAVVVWGARTTVDPMITDWLYVNVRRLLLYVEESIEEGIRWSVFKPNNLELWQKLKRTISDFLTRVWRSGALFGEKPEQAFYVRIDESLNPPSTRAIGRLYIEIGVAPVRPAEFVIVRIGLWDGGSDVTES